MANKDIYQMFLKEWNAMKPHYRLEHATHRASLLTWFKKGFNAKGGDEL